MRLRKPRFEVKPIVPTAWLQSLNFLGIPTKAAPLPCLVPFRTMVSPCPVHYLPGADETDSVRPGIVGLPGSGERDPRPGEEAQTPGHRPEQRLPARLDLHRHGHAL